MAAVLLFSLAVSAAQAGTTGNLTPIAGYYPTVAGSVIAAMGDEYASGLDFDGSGQVDAGWNVITTYDIATGELGWAEMYGSFPWIEGDLVCAEAREAGVYDYDGDGATNGVAVACKDLSDGTADLELLDFTYAWGNRSAVVGGDLVVWLVFEYYLGEDLNGDGDLYDPIGKVYDRGTGQSALIGYGQEIVTDGASVFFWTQESRFGEDLDGDPSNDASGVAAYDVATGDTILLQADASWPRVSGDILAMAVDEGVLLYDLTDDRSTVLTELEGSYEHDIDGSLLVTEVYNDDPDGPVMAVHHIPTGTTSWPGLCTDGLGIHVDGIIATYTVNEMVFGDLNGNGYSQDRIVAWTDLSVYLPTVSVPVLQADVEEALASGTIDTPGTATSLAQQLVLADSAIADGDPVAAARALTVFITLVEAQAGRKIDEETASDLIAAAEDLIATL